MNKNNLIGLVLMGAVIMLFMYFNQPSPEERAAMAEKQKQEQADAAKSDVDRQQILTDTMVTPQERALISSTIRQLGVKDSTSGITRLTVKNVVLTLSADSAIG